MANDQKQVFVQNIIVILVVLLGIGAIFVILFRIMGSTETVIAAQQIQTIAEETRPVGEFRVSGSPAQGNVSEVSVTVDEGETAETEVHPGKSVYDGLCFSCHSTNLPNIPQLGDTVVWAEKVEQGIPLLYERAINGFTGASGMAMPPKGGDPSLTDEEVRAAVDYIIANSQ